mgnify:CR=1 FL=1
MISSHLSEVHDLVCMTTRLVIWVMEYYSHHQTLASGRALVHTSKCEAMVQNTPPLVAQPILALDSTHESPLQKYLH